MMADTIRLLALDIDGTLMDRQKHFPAINGQMLRRCQAAGMEIALVSGRSFELIRGFARELDIHAHIAACNGARIEAGENGPTIFETGFPREQAAHIYAVLERSGMYFNSYTRGKCFMGNPEARPALGARYSHHIPGVIGEAGFLYETVCDRARMLSEGMEGVYKFVVMGAEYDPGFERIRAELSDLSLSVSSASRRNIEFMPTGVDKGSAVRFLMRYLNIEAAQAMAFGDQTNDLPMLNAVGWPVAMENGEASVKAAARAIAPDHNLGGVGLYLQNQFFDGE